MTTLKNSFHGTEAKTRLSEEELIQIRYTHPMNRTKNQKRLVSRLRHELCGMQDCKCGGEFGER